MKMQKGFIWVPFYEELATKLLEYKDNRQEMVEKVKKAFGLKKKEKYYFDPFSVFSYLNSFSYDNRVVLLEKLKSEFGVECTIPSDFCGVLYIMTTSRNFSNNMNDVNKMWALFECALDFNDNDDGDRKKFIRCYDDCMKVQGVRWKLAAGLYWVRPKQFLILNEPIRKYISTKNLCIEELQGRKGEFTKVPNGRQYLELREHIAEHIKKKFEGFIPAFSYKAVKLFEKGKQSCDEVADTIGIRKFNHGYWDDENKTNKTVCFPLNQILYGPPGTGKTYNTKNYAVAIIDGRNIDEVMNDDYSKIETRYDELVKQGQIKFITFHHSYSYEDFVEGIKPLIDKETKQISYEVKQGLFRKICDVAGQNSDKPYILIIDEINRGNISKIFGELITLIEDDKRDVMSVTLPYSQEEFTVPKNLYIIGTMNTADRSVAAMDIALRRRFTFKEMMPNTELVPEKVGGIGLREKFKELNKRISILLDRDHQIGHSYFMGVKSVDNLQNVWFDKIIPLLNEYFYGDWEKLKIVIPGFVDDTEAVTDDIKQLFGNDKMFRFLTKEECTENGVFGNLIKEMYSGNSQNHEGNEW